MLRFEWQPFLTRWSQEWADAYDAGQGGRDDDRDAWVARWLGFGPAAEERIVALEQRIGRPLPPSLRSFLQVTDGWRHAGHFVYLLAGAERIDWCGDPHGMSTDWLEQLGEDADEEEIREAGVWARSLQLALDSDMVDVLLDPEDVDERGEWAVYTYASWRGAPPERYPSFRHFMEDMYQEFLSMSADDPGFDNDTTRSLDAGVERAREQVLSGAYEEAAEALTEAVACGRPRAAQLLAQIRPLSGQGVDVEAGASLDDPYVAGESMPLNCAEEARSGRSDDAWFLGRYPEEDRETVARVLERIRQGTYEYEASGPFGDAVRVARDLARRARPEAAWRVLAAAVPSWQPATDDHIAPVGLLADSVLGPVVTPERGRALLATPRGAAATPSTDTAGSPAPPTDDGIDADGLAWLAETDGNMRPGFRLVLVEGVEPADLHQRMGAGGPLLPALRTWDASTRHGSPDAETWEQRVTVRVGNAGPNWSFAHAADGTDARQSRFRSPSLDASHGTRALTLVLYPDPFFHGTADDRPHTFHFSLAQDGHLLHSLIVHDSEVTSTGEAPAALAPDRLLFDRTNSGGPDNDTAAPDIRRALALIAAEFDLTLSQEALLHGRLDGFETVSWLREPQPGESWAYFTVGGPLD
ncbi:SMI1/KNR4 family protein [Streptomyces sp. CBMA152]|uniref:SMI1/KNR4 family protein n=1 Tax=Streptomyces sp. CBMA152 TaxID=1896312 RepID=UPI0016603485|nr:SMI1/KNR4 family protein [Streptomyces sp. CBMA152]MBD0742756.1 hypothetical protein [Streptomyces sp. CBMA152]